MAVVLGDLPARDAAAVRAHLARVYDDARPALLVTPCAASRGPGGRRKRRAKASLARRQDLAARLAWAPPPDWRQLRDTAYIMGREWALAGLCRWGREGVHDGLVTQAEGLVAAWFHERDDMPLIGLGKLFEVFLTAAREACLVWSIYYCDEIRTSAVMAWDGQVREKIQRGAYFPSTWAGFARAVAEDWAEYVPITDEEGQDAVRRLDIDVGTWAWSVRARVAEVMSAVGDPGKTTCTPRYGPKADES